MRPKAITRQMKRKHNTMEEKQTISLNINGTDIRFNVDTTAEERLIDELKDNSKVGPMRNFLIRVVAPESKEALKPFLASPSAIVQIAEKVTEGFAPTLKIALGE